jgi:hypothetical protein
MGGESKFNDLYFFKTFWHDLVKSMELFGGN